MSGIDAFSSGKHRKPEAATGTVVQKPKEWKDRRPFSSPLTETEQAAFVTEITDLASDAGLNERETDIFKITQISPEHTQDDIARALNLSPIDVKRIIKYLEPKIALAIRNRKERQPLQE